ncbi:MAG: 7-cyano-7-deazaguanine synthase QueC [Candidatus Aminicenantes bacterium]
MKKCCVLFSGGIDSTTALYWALNAYGTVFALTFDYGQRHAVEIQSSRKLSQKLNISQTILTLDLQQASGSALTDLSIPLPEFRSAEEIEPGVPPTYVPFRNGIFLSMAAAWAEVHDIRDIICGFNVVDSPGYPDTTRGFADAMEKAINIGTKASAEKSAFRIRTPFVGKKKSEIIQRGIALNADYSHSISCYAGKEIPCLRCSSCLLRQRAWEEVGRRDPLLERLEKEKKL